MTPRLRTRGLTKRFGSLTALDAVDLEVAPGEIHAVLGENGAGKSTLMNLLYGLLAPDAGTIHLDGEPHRFASPAAALAAGIGMVHQHFMLVERLTVWENVWLVHPDRPRGRLDAAAARSAVGEIAERFQLRLDPDARVEDLPVGDRQRVEIAKALARPCSVLILDEPTAVLAPTEVEPLFDVCRTLAAAGTAVLLISHKLDEVLDVSGRITVLRRGAVTYRADTDAADPDALTRAIVGDAPEAVADGERRVGTPPMAVRLSVRSLSRSAGRTPLRDIAFDLRAGEILAVAGVDGNGQDELVEVLAGLAALSAGTIALDGDDVTGLSVRERWARGLAIVPGDRSRNGLWPDASVWENLALREFGARWARGFAGTVNPARHRARASELVGRHDVRTAGVDAPVRSLSGGNQQKLLFARELAAAPHVLVVQNPTRGLDVGAARALHDELRTLRDSGGSVLLLSTELDEVLEIGDRFAALSGGRLREAARGDAATLGALMLRTDAA